MKSNYFGHDQEYQSRQAAGRPGWADAATLSSNLKSLAKDMQSKHAPQSGSVLELGCGAGDLTLWLAGSGYDAHGVDISPTAVSWAQEKAKSRKLTAQFRIGNVLDLNNYADARFDLVLDGYCLHCIIGEDRQSFLKSARRVLKPDGVLHLRTMCGDFMAPHLNVRPKLIQEFDPASRCLISPNGVATRHIGLADDILREVELAGLRVQEYRVDPSFGRLDDMDSLMLWASK